MMEAEDEMFHTCGEIMKQECEILVSEFGNSFSFSATYNIKFDVVVRHVPFSRVSIQLCPFESFLQQFPSLTCPA